MNKQEASYVLKMIKDLYPTFHLSQTKGAMLMRELLPMDYEGVMKNVMKHVANHPYPPTIVEIAAYPKQQTNETDKLDAWRKQAQDVSQEMKEQFFQKMYQLLKDKSYEKSH